MTDDDARPLCPYCKANNNCVTGMRKGYGPPRKGDVSICMNCSGLALFTGNGIALRIPSFEEKHMLLTDMGVASTIQIVNHIRTHHTDPD